MIRVQSKYYFVFFAQLVFAIFISVEAAGQNNKNLENASKVIDSLAALISKDKPDTNKVNHLNQLCYEYRKTGNLNTGLPNASEALLLATKLNFKKGISSANFYLGTIYSTQGNYPEALKNYFAALQLYEEMNNLLSIAKCYGSIGIIYMEQGNYNEALKNYLAALKIQEQINDVQGIAISQSNIGGVLFYQGKYPEAIKSNKEALKMQEKINDKPSIAATYNNIGAIYMEQAKVLEQQHGNSDSIKKQLNEGLKNIYASLKIKEEMGDKLGMASSFLNLGEAQTKLKNITEAKDFLEKALKLGLEAGNKELIKETYISMAVLDSIRSNYKGAFDHYRQYIIYRDSLNNEETRKASIKHQLKYEYDKKEAVLKEQQEKETAVAQEQNRRQQIIIWAVGVGLVLVIIFAMYVWRSLKITHKQKLVIEEKQKEILDSIKYAKRIQTALITNEKYIDKTLRDLDP